MPRTCTVEDHPKILEINDDLVRKVPYAVVAKKYGLSWDAVRRHAKNHLQMDVKRAKDKYIQKKQAEESFKTTLNIIENLLGGSDPQLAEQMTLKDYIRLLELRAKLLGEEKASQPRIEIVWGAGLKNEEEKKEEVFRINVPAIQIIPKVDGKSGESGERNEVEKAEKEEEIEKDGSDSRSEEVLDGERDRDSEEALSQA